MSVKVSDLVNISEKFISDISSSMKKLDDLTRKYSNTDSLFDLEGIKKEFNAELQYYAKLYSKIKAYKGPNHAFLENEINKFKSEAYAQIMAQGNSATAAEKLLASFFYYEERLSVANTIIQTFTKFEEMYKRYDYTLTCIVQSISVGSKEYSHSQKVN